MKRIGPNRRQFLGAATVLAASALAPRLGSAQNRSVIKAVAFDAFAVFDPRSFFRLAEELFPGRGALLSSQWSTRQFEYTWLRNSMHEYTDFWNVTQDALNYAAKQSKVSLGPEQKKQLMSAFLELKPWPDVAAVLQALQKRGLRLSLLSNMTETMMQRCVEGSILGQCLSFNSAPIASRHSSPTPSHTTWRSKPSTCKNIK